VDLPPHEIDRLLTKSELDAVLLHELTHARRRDNLIRLIHEIGLCLLWFHPLVWITGSRLALYRELSCDESVIQRAQGKELISALAKLSNPKESFLLQATAGSILEPSAGPVSCSASTHQPHSKRSADRALQYRPSLGLFWNRSAYRLLFCY
jgi:Zn-dependent protease with chaperone function